MVLRVAEQFPRVATVRHRAHKRFHVVDDLRGHVAANIVFNPFAQWFTLELRDAVALRPGCPAVPLVCVVAHRPNLRRTRAASNSREVGFIFWRPCKVNLWKSMRAGNSNSSSNL